MGQPLAEARAQLRARGDLSDAVRARAERMLHELHHPPSLLDEAGSVFLQQGLQGALDQSGQSLGPYELLELLGHGGMSSVYKARRRDSEIQKLVAIKLIHPLHLSASALAMFEREQQALARLNHNHIVTFHHGGVTQQGTPYLVMDYIEGAQPIDAWARQRGASTRAIVRAFLQVADAIHCAHTGLVIHRDIKPANVLVDANDQIKVVDFGIASLDSEHNEMTTLVFTPEYAAPEQIAGQAVGTLADVFSLGAMLLALISGRAPLPAYAERLAHPDNDARHVRAVLHTTALDSDLRNVLASALKTDPRERHASVQDLRQDLSNWLVHKPVSATADSPWYRVQKFIQRNRALSALIALTVVSTAIGIATTVHQKAAAQHQAMVATEVKQLLLQALQSNDPNLSPGRPMNVRDLLLQARLDLNRRTWVDDELRSELQHTVGTAFGAIGEYDVAIEMLDLAALGGGERGRMAQLQAVRQLLQAERYDAAEERMQRWQPRSEDTDRVQTLAALLRARLLQHRSDFQSAERLLRETLQAHTAEALSGERIELQRLLARVLADSGRMDEGLALLQRALEESKTRLGELNTHTIDVLQDQAELLQNDSQQGVELAAAALEHALALQQRMYPSGHPQLITSLNMLSNIERFRGRIEVARTLAEAAQEQAHAHHGNDSVLAARSSAALSSLALVDGHTDEAIRHLQHTVAVYEAHYGAAHFETNQYKTNLAALLLKNGQAVQAETLLNQLHAQQLAQLGPHHQATLYVQLNRIKALSMQQRHSAAIELGQASLPQAETHLGSDHIVTTGLRLALAGALYDRGDYAEAAPLLLAAESSTVVQSNPTYHKDLLLRCITALIKSGQHASAQAQHRKALERFAQEEDGPWHAQMRALAQTLEEES